MFPRISSGYCIYFHTYEVFSGVLSKCFIRVFRVFELFRTYVASVSFRCFKTRPGVAASVLYACSMCFIGLQTYVASVAFGCFKNRSGVASLSWLFCCLTFVSVSPPPGASWASAAPRPLLDACVLLQLLAACMHVRKRRGHQRGLLTCS